MQAVMCIAIQQMERIRISGGMLESLKYIAAYQTSPVSALTHYAVIDCIEPYGDSGKYKLIFKGDQQEMKPIPNVDTIKGSMQGIRYTHSQNYKMQTK
jgi:hypothetical protein